MITFAEAFRDSLMNRTEAGDGKSISEPLWKSESHKKHLEELRLGMDAMNVKDGNAIWTTIYSMFDLYSVYFYGVGVQDGLAMARTDFPEQLLRREETQ